MGLCSPLFPLTLPFVLILGLIWHMHNDVDK